jgi:phosphoglycolate phosphatase
MKKYDGIIFDLDGTMWDATYVLTDAWNEAYESMHLEHEHVITRNDLMSCMGLIIPQIVAKLYPEYDRDTQLAIMKRATQNEEQRLLSKGGILFPKLEETLAALVEAGYPLYVVSNCQAGYIETFLKAHHLEKYFSDLECPGNTGLLKADNIELVVKRNHCKNPVYVGDTKGDADASHKAGVPFVFAAYGFGNVAAQDYEYRIEQFEDLTKLFL